MSDKWHDRFMQMAIMVSTWSKDPKRKVGAVIVAPDLRQFSVGYNGFPRGVKDTNDRLYCKNLKLSLMVHAERNAMYNCPFNMKGSTIYVTKYPCAECAKGIVQTGIRLLVTEKADFGHKTWGPSFLTAELILKEGGVHTLLMKEVDHETGDGREL